MLNNILKSCIYSFIVTFLIVLWKFLSYEKIITSSFVSKISIYIQTNPSFFIFLFFSSFLLLFFYLKKYQIINKYLYKYRWILSFVFLFFCILFKLSGSSIGSWNYIYQNSAKDDGILIGVDRSVHADEYCVYTPMTISQFYNKNQTMPYFSDTLRAEKTDTFIVYGQPVNDILVLFRPFHIPYLFLGLERGFSFYWYGRLILLFMLTFEFFMLFTKKNKMLSFIGSIIVTFSPTIQWWVSVNSLVEMIVLFESFILIFNLYIKSKYNVRILLSVLLAYISFSYVLTFYPAWQIPFLYLLFIFIFYLFIENKNYFCLKKDLFTFCLYLVLFLIFILCLYIKSGTTIQSIVSTVYPGNRLFNGGGHFLDLFHYPYTLTLALTSVSFYMNSEVWTLFTSFFDFFPLGIIFSFIILFGQKHKNKLIISLLILWIFLFAYTSFGFPKSLAKITLMSHSTSFRAFTVLSFINVFLLIYSMSLIKIELVSKNSIIISVFLSYFLIFLCIMRNLQYYSHYMILLLFPVLFLSFFFLLSGKTKKFLIMVLIVSFFTGVMSNPVRIGLNPILQNDLFLTIREQTMKNDGKWFVENLPFPINNYPIMAGAPTINCTNTYPNLSLMNRLDPLNKYEFVYNRYGSFSFIITAKETSFELLNPDYFNIYINVNDIQKLNAEFILTDRELEKFDNSQISFIKIKEIEEYKIYRISEINS